MSLFGQTDKSDPTASVSSKKNILYIIIDDMNDYAYGEGNGNNTPATPMMDSLSDFGFTFDNCFTNAPICGPSRTSFITGKTPVYTGVLYNPQKLVFRDLFHEDQRIVTLMEHLRNNGYYSVGIQKIFHNFWRPGYDNDTLLSFDEYTVHDDDPFVAIHLENVQDEGYQWGIVDDADEPKLMDHKSVTLALKYLEDHATATLSDTSTAPLLLTVGIDKPHLPSLVPEKYFPLQFERDYTTATEVNYYTPSTPDGWIMPEYSSAGADSIYGNLTPAGKLMVKSLNEVQWGVEDWADENASTTAFNKFQLEKMRMANMDMAYYAACKYADAQVGRLIQGLKDYGLLKNTIVVIHSDHGFALGQRREWTKQTLWDDVLRVPLIIFDPSIKGGKRISAPVSLVDVFPTILELAGVEPPALKYLDGASLVPIMKGELRNRPVHSRILDPYTSNLDCAPQQSMRSGDWHYIQYESCTGTIETELYNLETDPYEWNNVADEPAYAMMQEYLESLLPLDSTWRPKDQHIMQLTVNADTVFSDETIVLTADVVDSSGAIISKPSATKFKISNNFNGTVYVGGTLNFDLSTFSSSMISEPTEITFNGFLVRNGSGQIFTMASKTVTVLPAVALKPGIVNHMGEMRMFPNPASNFLNLQLESHIETSADIHIYAMDGKHWHRQSIDMSEGGNQYRIALDHLPEGMYQLVVRMDDGTETQGGLFAVSH